MKTKTLVGIFVFIIMLYIGVAFGSSFLAQRRFHERIEEANQWLVQNARDVRIVDMGYERGLFNSTARFAIEWNARSSFMRQNFIDVFPEEFAQSNVIRLMVDSQIRTGPWLGRKGFGIVRINSVVNFDPQTVPQNLIQGFNGQNMVTSEVTMGYAKELSFSISGAPFYFTDGEDIIDFRGFQTQLNSTFITKNGDFSFHLPYFVVTSDAKQHQFILTNLFYTSQGSRHEDLTTWMFSGHHENTIERLGVVANGSSIFELNTFQVLSDQKVSNNLYAQQTQATFAGSYWGRPYQGKISYDLNNINYTEWQKIVDLSALGNNKGIEQVFERATVNFIKTAPSVSIRPVELTYNGQTFDLRINTGFRSSNANELQMPVPMLLISKIYYNMSVQIPTAFITPQFLGEKGYQSLVSMINAGYLVRQGSNAYAADFSLESGRTILNGREISLLNGPSR